MRARKARREALSLAWHDAVLAAWNMRQVGAREPSACVAAVAYALGALLDAPTDRK